MKRYFRDEHAKIKFDYNFQIFPILIFEHFFPSFYLLLDKILNINLGGLFILFARTYFINFNRIREKFMKFSFYRVGN